MGKHYYPYASQTGYTEIIGAESALDLLGFGLINLEKNDTIKLASGNYELGLVVLAVPVPLNAPANVLKTFAVKMSFPPIPFLSIFPLPATIRLLRSAGLKLPFAKLKLKSNTHRFWSERMKSSPTNAAN